MCTNWRGWRAGRRAGTEVEERDQGLGEEQGDAALLEQLPGLRVLGLVMAEVLREQEVSD